MTTNGTLKLVKLRVYSRTQILASQIKTLQDQFTNNSTPTFTAIQKASGLLSDDASHITVRVWPVIL